MSLSLPAPSPRRWNREEYHRAAELGIFRPDERLELIEGEVVQKVSPQSSPHAYAVMVSADVLEAAFGPSFHVREEKPLVMSDVSEPEPDVLVVRGSLRENPKHPTPENTVLVLEVSESTLAFDQGRKAAAYAKAGIQDYWVVNLRERHLEVRRDPVQQGDSSFTYRVIQILKSGAEIAPLVLPLNSIRVDELLPPEADEEDDSSN
jgi:Uma2 family endonuclease